MALQNGERRAKMLQKELNQENKEIEDDACEHYEKHGLKMYEAASGKINSPDAKANM
jgi:hypothetical protein